MKLVDQLLEYIDVYGIERIRQTTEQISQTVYHMVFYKAVDDELRIIYAMIFSKLKFI